ncbi:MAG: sulfide/dihydroorotate dehydrogenase-like FAD/NAD-binding protein [Elusimicrobiota bacterium]|jgi:ferredoxin--NADP+ reductase|nr:sulfide/dihydroorotate dehydrogenase-like FAD/NAD-binding protein [Elusimicrobiota bacterium]
MYKIISKKLLSPKIYNFLIYAPEVAKNAKAGQFIMFRIDDKGERVPLTIAGANVKEGWVRIIFQEIGKSTSHLACLEEGDFIKDFAGPLGKPTEIKKYGTVVAVAGGVGTAEILPVIKELKKTDNKIITIIGARSKDLIILEDELKAESDELFFATNDGSRGIKGLVTDILREVISNEKVDLIYAIGPAVMMRASADVSKEKKIPTMVSLNPIMVDASGMCGACRVVINGETKFACVDGPEFDAHLVDWEELYSRLTLFKENEQISLDKFKKSLEDGNCGCPNKE